jgi:hypothetical protein
MSFKGRNTLENSDKKGNKGIYGFNGASSMKFDLGPQAEDLVA